MIVKVNRLSFVTETQGVRGRNKVSSKYMFSILINISSWEPTPSYSYMEASEPKWVNPNDI